MRIAVYGATGMIGRDIVIEAAYRGHQVTALSRTPGEFGFPVASSAGDMVDLDEVAAVAIANDVVISAMGPSRTNDAEAREWPRRLRDFALAVGTTRLVVVGGAGTLIVAPGMRFLDSPDFMEEYRTEAELTAAGFYQLQALPADVKWTFVSPPFLIERGEKTGQYKVGSDSPVGDKISTQDFAVAILDEVQDPRHVCRRFTVAN